jgi:hypothetical protein
MQTDGIWQRWGVFPRRRERVSHCGARTTASSAGVGARTVIVLPPVAVEAVDANGRDPGAAGVCSGDTGGVCATPGAPGIGVGARTVIVPPPGAVASSEGVSSWRGPGS